MKIGDLVKLINNPNLDWMRAYADKTFQVLDFPTEKGVELMMIGTNPSWVWLIGQDNLYIVENP
jgi:hypothetical protein